MSVCGKGGAMLCKIFRYLFLYSRDERKLVSWQAVSSSAWMKSRLQIWYVQPTVNKQITNRKYLSIGEVGIHLLIESDSRTKPRHYY